MGGEGEAAGGGGGEGVAEAEEGSREGADGMELPLVAGAAAAAAVDGGGRSPAAFASIKQRVVEASVSSRSNKQRAGVCRCGVCEWRVLTEPGYGVEFAFEQCECDFYALDVLLHLSQLVFADGVELVEEVDGVDDETVDNHQHLPENASTTRTAGRCSGMGEQLLGKRGCCVVKLWLCFCVAIY